MKVFLIILLFFSIINSSNSQSRSYRYTNFIEHKNIFIEAHAGVSIGGNETVNTGFYENNENKRQVKISTNSGSLIGISIIYLINLKLDYLVGYDYQFSTLEKQYENGKGLFKRNVFFTMLKYSPFIAKQSRFNLGLGINSVLNSKIDVSGEMDEGKVRVQYFYKKSFGPIVFSEFQIYFNKWITSSIAIKYNANNLKLKSAEFNNYSLSKSFVPSSAREFESNCLFFQIAFSVVLF